MGKLFPLFHQRGVARFVLIEFLGLALAFFGADEVLQRGFQVCNGGLGAADCFFQLVDAIFHLLASDGIQALLWGFGSVKARTIAVGRSICSIGCRKIPTSRNGSEKWGTHGFGWLYVWNVVERGRDVLTALLPPEIVFVVAGEDFDFAVATFEDARSQLVDEVAVVGDEDDRTGIFH